MPVGACAILPLLGDDRPFEGVVAPIVELAGKTVRFALDSAHGSACNAQTTGLASHRARLRAKPFGAREIVEGFEGTEDDQRVAEKVADVDRAQTA